MTFPDGRIKDGYFDNNVFKGQTKIVEGSRADLRAKEEAKTNQSAKDGPLQLAAPQVDGNNLLNVLDQNRSSLTREPREVRIKTRGGSNSVRRQ